ncbi:MAG: branched-chain amino acid ABC transporter permease [Alphaproteobacteria bacterium]
MVIGAFYGVVGLGITFVLRVTKVLNLSHSALAMLMGMAYAKGLALGYPMLLVLPAVLLLGTALGWLQGAFLRPWLSSGHEIIAVFLTLGIGLLMEGASLIVFGKDPLGAPPIVKVADLHIGGAVVAGPQIILIGLTVLGTALFALWYFSSHTGKLYRAIVDDEYGALVMGVPIARLQSAAFAIGGLMAAVAGIGVTPIISMSHSSGGIMLVNGITASILGGASNPFGALLGGLVVGIIQTFVAGTISSLLMLPASMALLLIVLIFRPDGLLPVRLKERTL